MNSTPTSRFASTMFRPHGSTAMMTMPGTMNTIGASVNTSPSATRRLQHFLLHQLDRVGNRLQQAERPEPVRPQPRLHAPHDPPLDPDVDDRHGADERHDADRPEQRRHHVHRPVRRARICRSASSISPLRFERSRMSHQLSVTIVSSARDHRSSSPTLISMLPSVTIASAIVLPDGHLLQHAQVDQRRRAARASGTAPGPPSLTT